MNEQRVPRIFSVPRRANRLARSLTLARGKSPARWLFEEMEQDCIERLEFMRFEPARALLAGPASSALGSVLSDRGAEVSLIAQYDEEKPIVDAPFDLIVSLARLDTVNDLPGALLHTRMALNEGGLFIGQMVGAGSLPMLRQLMLAADAERPAARIHPQVDNRAATALLERAGFARQVVDSQSLNVSYRSLDRLVADLREQGLTNVLADPPPPLGKAGLARARDAFDALKDSEGRVNETFEILTLTGWR
ncbi:methyltransferase domain-containing protein [Altererythrobacter sp.]|uniref:methyltransferase domain-containing protein n=1 Tax=Altererythrobacter sp. TaxID=1872480 RepID=UPI003D070E9E